MMRLMHVAIVPAALVVLVSRAPAAADVGPDAREVGAVVSKAVAYLRLKQGKDGSFSPRLAGPGVSAVVAAGLLRNGLSAKDPVVSRTLAYLEKSVKKDGGIYDRGLANYTTSVALMAFADANQDGRYNTVIKNATTFLRRMQYGPDKIESGDERFGGVGYDARSRPDMSNTQFFLDALQAAGVPKDDPAVQRALTFVSRCQNLPGEFNDLAYAKKTSANDRGGLVYNPHVEDKGRDLTPQGGLRSVGAMTYAGLKSFLYAGVTRDDPRVKAAVRWIRAHYTLSQNPGMGQAGLYYYYQTFAKAMNALGEDRFEDARKMKHDWRKELFEAIRKRQRSDGSFINVGDRAFGEGDPDLATAFALLALSYTYSTSK